MDCVGKANGDAAEKCDGGEASYVIISTRAEGADMPTGKAKSRCAWEALNLPTVRCLLESA